MAGIVVSPVSEPRHIRSVVAGDQRARPPRRDPDHARRLVPSRTPADQPDQLPAAGSGGIGCRFVSRRQLRRGAMRHQRHPFAHRSSPAITHLSMWELYYGNRYNTAHGIDDRRDPERPSITEVVPEEIDVPPLVGAFGGWRRYLRRAHPFLRSLVAQEKAFLAIQPVNPLRVHLPALAS